MSIEVDENGRFTYGNIVFQATGETRQVFHGEWAILEDLAGDNDIIVLWGTFPSSNEHQIFKPVGIDGGEGDPCHCPGCDWPSCPAVGATTEDIARANAPVPASIPVNERYDELS